MIKKIIAVILALSTLTFLLTACMSGEDEDLYYPLYADPVSFDPQIAADNASKIVVFNCFEGLVKSDIDGKIIPGVAKTWEVSQDGLVYTFHLRQDSKWYMSKYAKELLPNQTAENFNYSVIAEDFVYGLKRAFDKTMGAVTDSRLYAIKNAYEVYNGEKSSSELGVTAIDNYTLKIELTQPHDDFLFALTQSAAMPCREEFFLATKGRYGLDPEKVIYNGPFYLYSWSVGSNLVLLRNENYKGENPVKPSGVYLYINSDLTTRVDKLLDGTYDACPLNVRQKMTIDDKNITYLDYTNSTWGFSFNCEDEIMSNYNMRSALTSAIDVTKLTVPEFCEGYASGLVPDICMAGGVPFRLTAGKIKNVQKNDKTAKKHLSLAFEKLDIDKAEISIICHESFEETVKIAIQSWQKTLGVHVSFIVTPLNDIALEERFKSGDYDMAFTKITAESESVLSFLGKFTSTDTGNIFRFKSKKYDSLIINSDKSINQQEIFQNCIEAEQYLIDMSVFIPVFTEESFLAKADNVDGVYSIEAGCVPIFYNGTRK